MDTIDNDALMEEIRKHPVLHKKASKDYKDKNKICQQHLEVP